MSKGGRQMKLLNKLSRAITAFFVKTAYKSAGQVSTNGTYQPKEPASLQFYKK
jgi:cyclic lactone autoinducer peptide